MAGLVGIPVSASLYWLMLRYRREAPFPKGGLLRLIMAAVFSVLIAGIVSVPVTGIIMLGRLGVFSDLSGWLQTMKNDPEAILEMIQDLDRNALSATLWSMINMFFSAGLPEEGLKFLTCRTAIRKKGMICTWMDVVTAFAVVGITFELLENIAYGAGSDVISALARACAPAHFVFGVIMGYFYGKYLFSRQKKYRLLSFVLPVLYHTAANGFMARMSQGGISYALGFISAISFILAAVITVTLVIRWQKNRTLDIPVRLK